MKKLLALTVVVLLLAGCSSPPQQDVNGMPWEADWITLGDYLGVDVQKNGLVSDTCSNALVATRGISYATWIMGESIPYTNSDGEELTLYDAQVYLLLQKFSSHSAATEALALWESDEHYLLTDARTQAFGDQTFTVYTVVPTDDRPYVTGLLALAVRGKYTVSVELMCRNEGICDCEALLSDFLQSLHYR